MSGEDILPSLHSLVNSKMSEHCVDAQENQHDPAFAHDEKLTTSYQVTDDDGCTIDS